jgi:hypothetical protein
VSAQIIPADLSPSSVLIYCLVASILIPEMPGPAYGFAPFPAHSELGLVLGRLHDPDEPLGADGFEQGR